MSAIERAVQIAGSQSELARRIDVTPQAVSQWLRAGFCPPGRALDVSGAVGGKVSERELLEDRSQRQEEHCAA